MTVRYRWQGVALLRASTDPGALDLPGELDLLGDAEAGRRWLEDLWRRREVRDALTAASPVLCRQIVQVTAGECRDPRQERRVALSVASYLLRWQRRATPFGLFAGVAPVRIGAQGQVAWGQKHLTTVRPDAEWLADVIARLERCPQLLERLPVVVNSAGQMRGNRYVVPGPPADGRAQLLAPVEVSVRRTRPVTAALDAAAVPLRYSDLRSRLTARFPAAGAERIDAMLGSLIDQNVLITSLRAPMTSLDPLGHLCAQLQAAGAHTISDIAEQVHELYGVRDELAGQRPTAPWSARTELIERMSAISAVTPVPLAADTALDCDIRIPEQVVREAEDAVSVLYRLTPHPFGYQHWRDYHGRFRARYGAGAVVPVLDLVADSGLGLPAEYIGSARGRAPRPLTERDEKLLTLIQQAMLDAQCEITLTEPLIADLSAGEDADILPIPRAEVAVEIHAASLEAMERGVFRLAVTGTPRPGSSMAGRFAHILPAEEQARLADTYRAIDPHAIAAQLSFAPRRRRNENIARTQQLLPHVISLAEYQRPHEGSIPLADLAVTADARQFRLVQLSTGKHVEPRVLHALEAAVHTPPLARFLAEITTARSAVYKAFDFGAAAHLPYLPRVRYKRTILTPARWLLTTRDLPGRGASTHEWEKVFEAWRARLGVPEHTTMVENTQRLPLDLTHSVHRLLLRTRLDSARRLELREAPTPQDLGWLGRAHELLLPLTLHQPIAASTQLSTRLHPVPRDAGHLPGRATVLAAQLHGHPDRYDDILTEHLSDLINAFETPPQWWFRRHREMPRPDADQHLAIYLRLPHPDAYSQAAQRIADWASELRRGRLLARLTLETYEPQTGRYGHGPALAAAHAVFAADSAAALAQIRMTAPGDVHPEALAAASLVDLATHFAATAEEGLHCLVRYLPQEHGPLDRTLRDHALELADPNSTWPTLCSLPGGTDVAATWQTRANALAAYRQTLSAQRDPLTALRSLLHLHHVRALGVDPDGERITSRLARACALRHTAHRPKAHQ